MGPTADHWASWSGVQYQRFVLLLQKAEAGRSEIYRFWPRAGAMSHSNLRGDDGALAAVLAKAHAHELGNDGGVGLHRCRRLAAACSR